MVIFGWDVDSEAPFDYVTLDDLNDDSMAIFEDLTERRQDEFVIEMFGPGKIFSMFQKIEASVTSGFRKTEIDRLNAQFFRLLYNGKTWRQSYIYMMEGEGLVMRSDIGNPRKTKNSAV